VITGKDLKKGDPFNWVTKFNHYYREEVVV